MKCNICFIPISRRDFYMPYEDAVKLCEGNIDFLFNIMYLKIRNGKKLYLCKKCFNNVNNINFKSISRI